MGVALHPYIVGQPYRLKHIRRALEHIKQYTDQNPGTVWFCKPEEIDSYARGLPEGTLP
jgi:hypothetical protein